MTDLKTPIPMVPENVDVGEGERDRLFREHAPGFILQPLYLWLTTLPTPVSFDPYGGGDLGFGERGAAVAGSQCDARHAQDGSLDYCRGSDKTMRHLDDPVRWGQRVLSDFRRPTHDHQLGGGGTASGLPSLTDRPVLGDRADVVFTALEEGRIDEERALRMLEECPVE